MVEPQERDLTRRRRGTVADDVPTPAEMFRLLTRVDKRLDDIDRHSSERERDFEADFVRKETFNAVRATDDTQAKGFENELHSVVKRFDSLETKLDTRFKDLEAKSDAKDRDLESKLDTKTKDLKTHIDAIEGNRRTDRMWIIGGLGFPLILMLISAIVVARLLAP